MFKNIVLLNIVGKNTIKNVKEIIQETIKNYGDNDYLSDFGDVSKEVRYSMGALEPASVYETGSLKYNTDTGLVGGDYYTKDDNTLDSFLGDEVIAERIISAMKGSSTVDVKKKCRLAGLGNTSVACNQGDINNLEIKKINENIIFDLNELPFKDEVLKVGGNIFSVGGAVRDSFLGKESKDLDVLITGVPIDDLENILKKYGKVNLVGKSFGVLKFKPENHSDDIDIAIPRKDKATGEGGHRGFVIDSDHTLPIEDDLFRRDFTINAMAKDINGKIIDPFGGLNDLKNKIIRMVNPEAFSDDPLRMLRCIQFSSRFSFTIEPKTFEEIKKNAKKIKEEPSERILEELNKIVTKGNPVIGSINLIKSGLYREIFGKESFNIDSSLLKRVKTLGEFIFLLLKDIYEQPSQFFKIGLRGDNETYNEIMSFEIGFGFEGTNKIKTRLAASQIYKISPKSFNSDIFPDKTKQAISELKNNKYPKNILELEINGNDLMRLGYVGKNISEAQKKILANIYADKLKNNKEEILSWLKNTDNE
jgi:tRNA nucleotidyltransferase/poly(A) polymerase